MTSANRWRCSLLVNPNQLGAKIGHGCARFERRKIVAHGCNGFALSLSR
jgi:hypothetical protein